MSVQDQIDQLIALRAAQWYEEWRTGDLSDPSQLRAWLAESPRHLDVFLAIAGQDVALRDAFAAGRVEAPTQSPESPRTNIHVISTSRPVPGVAVRTGRVSWTIRLQVAAALVCVIAVSLGLWFGSATQWIEYATPVGEQRTVRLSDGSVVKLNAQSTLRVRFDGSRRELLLVGEALFKVAQDRSRPFAVHTPTTLVRALGTEFNVYSRPDGRVTVSVLEGHVDITPELPKRREGARAGPAHSIVIAYAGEQVERVGTGELIKSERPDVRAAVAWQDRKLVFRYTPLDDIVAEFNRYNAVKLRVDKLPSGPLSFTGVFDADDPQEFAQLLSQEPDLEVREGAQEIVIGSREPQQ